LCLPQRWASHNKEQQAAAKVRGSAAAADGGGGGGLTAAAAAALTAWANVGRSARAALKKANPHAVLELEMQIFDLLEQVGTYWQAGLVRVQCGA
jgi:hypothetical protein